MGQWRMTARAALIAIALAAASGAPALAEEDCTDPERQQTMNFCVSQEFWKLDDELNKTYEQALSYTADLDKNSEPPEPPDLKTATEALTIAEKAWLQYRDAHCDGIGYRARGGTLEPVLVGRCKIELTKNRMKELKEIMTSLAD